MIILVFSLLAIFTFLSLLNLHLRGTKKDLIAIIFGILIIACVVISFFISEWWYGIISILIMFALIGIFKPIAQVLASKILGYRVSIDEEPTYSVDSLMQKINEGNWDEAMQIVKKEDTHNRKLLLKIYSKPKIKLLLNENNITFDDFYDLYKNLKVILPGITMDILKSQIELKELIEFRKRNATDNEIIKHFRFDKI